MADAPQTNQPDWSQTNTYLLEGLKNSRDGNTWQAFVERYRPMIIAYAQRSFGLSRADAEDAAQEALNAFFERYTSGAYDRDKGRLRKWLFGIATNQIKNLLRKNAKRPEVLSTKTTGPGSMDYVPDDSQLEETWKQEWQIALFRQCFDEVRRQVDEKTINAYVLYAERHLPVDQVAAQLGMTINAVYLAKHHVLRRIREMINNMEELW